MELEEEIRVLESRLSEAPDSRLFVPLADALGRAGEYERAVRLCREGLEKFPGFTSARVLLARCLSEMGQHDEAKDILEELNADDSENIEVLKNLAVLAQHGGDRTAALNLYREARKIDSSDIEAIRTLETLEKEEEKTGAPVEESAPSSPRNEKKAGAEKEARASAVTEEEIREPGEVFLTHTLADIYRLQGHYEKAFDIYSALLEHDTGNEALRKEFGEVKARLSDKGAPAEDDKIEEEAAEPAEPVPSVPDRGGIGKDKQEGLSSKGTGEIEQRIDRIFDSILGKSTEDDEEWAERQDGESPPSSEDFFGMVENWISEIKTADHG